MDVLNFSLDLIPCLEKQIVSSILQDIFDVSQKNVVHED